MTDKEILQKIEQKVKDSENWSVYHHLTDNLGSPAEPGKPFSVQTLSSFLNALTELLDTVKPYIKK